MEDIIFILLAFAWLIYSFVKKNKKKQSEDKPVPQPTEQQPETGKKEKDFDTIFREILGEEVVEEIEVEEVSEDKQTEIPQPVAEHETGEYDRHSGMIGVEDNFEFSAEGKIETIEDQLEKQSSNKNRILEVVDIWEEKQTDSSILPELEDFDLRKAIIYSEIINRKY